MLGKARRQGLSALLDLAVGGTIEPGGGDALKVRVLVMRSVHSVRGSTVSQVSAGPRCKKVTYLAAKFVFDLLSKNLLADPLGDETGHVCSRIVDEVPNL